MNVQTISAQELNNLKQNGASVALLDVRTTVEYAEQHIKGALNIPLDQLDVAQYLKQYKLNDSSPVYVTCKGGKRGAKACEKFLAAGYSAVLNLEGGIQSWIAAELPVERDAKVISLERQVRIAAGTLVLSGVALALLVNPLFLALSGFVGAGLIFSGVTDTCGMAMILAKMPWNKRTT